MNTIDHLKTSQKAWVVFTGQTDLPWLKILRPGFRHCSVLLNDGARWITFDPLSNYTDIMVHNMPAQFDLPLWLKDRGHKIVPARIDRSMKPAPWMPMTCVESVKRVLGIHNMAILTPWQLYRHLTSSRDATGDNFLKGDLQWEA